MYYKIILQKFWEIRPADLYAKKLLIMISYRNASNLIYFMYI